jgi:hypothetical protein
MALASTSAMTNNNRFILRVDSVAFLQGRLQKKMEKVEGEDAPFPEELTIFGSCC